eukprot:COSAG01_NODE_1241_length_11085_cov_9.712361_11_plen_143_part_00
MPPPEAEAGLLLLLAAAAPRRRQHNAASSRQPRVGRKPPVMLPSAMLVVVATTLVVAVGASTDDLEVDTAAEIEALEASTQPTHGVHPMGADTRTLVQHDGFPEELKEGAPPAVAVLRPDGTEHGSLALEAFISMQVEWRVI